VFKHHTNNNITVFMTPMAAEKQIVVRCVLNTLVMFLIFSPQFIIMIACIEKTPGVT
jgi:sugar phosphate permease